MCSRYPIRASSVEVDTEYDKMTIRNVDATDDTITMDNKDNSITLSKNKDTALMAGIGIKTADQDDVTAENPLRFYIYKAATIEGAAAEAAPANVTAAAPVEAPAANVTIIELAPPSIEDMTNQIPPTEGETPIIKFGDGEPILPLVNST